VKNHFTHQRMPRSLAEKWIELLNLVMNHFACQRALQALGEI